MTRQRDLSRCRDKSAAARTVMATDDGGREETRAVNDKIGFNKDRPLTLLYADLHAMKSAPSYGEVMVTQIVNWLRL